MCEDIAPVANISVRRMYSIRIISDIVMKNILIKGTWIKLKPLTDTDIGQRRL
jgi:hypothetical protein